MAKSKTVRSDYYVYAYSLPTSPNTYFYVGKGRWDRAWTHLAVYNAKPKTPFYDEIRRLYKLGIRPVITLLFENLTEADAYLTEELLIKKIGRKCDGGALLNVLPGGEVKFVRRKRRRR